MVAPPARLEARLLEEGAQGGPARGGEECQRMTDDEIDTELRQADKSWNVMILSGAMVGMMRADPALTFAKFEERLRALGSKTFLISRPKRMRPAGMLVLGLDGKPRRRFLWICLDARNEHRLE